jgi:hypothetical protein
MLIVSLKNALNVLSVLAAETIVIVNVITDPTSALLPCAPFELTANVTVSLV